MKTYTIALFTFDTDGQGTQEIRWMPRQTVNGSREAVEAYCKRLSAEHNDPTSAYKIVQE